MPAPATVDEFLDLIQKSGVAESARVKGYVQTLAAGGTPATQTDRLAETMVRDGLLTFFQAEQLLQGKWKRFFIGKYKVLERIGTGGMGQVFLCEHKLMKRRVALKVLPAVKAQDPASLERFYREARAVAALDHPNIVRAYDIDQDENIHFLVMEYVDGPNLQDLVKKVGPLDPTRAAQYVAGAAIGLQHAHEMGLVHRDIKPGNVLVDRTGTVKVLDMGLARFFYDEDDLLTKKYDENVLGTADYLAPEQAVDSHSVDIRADIYSLGGTFYYLLTGSSPYPDGTVAQKLLYHQTRDPRPVRSLRPDVPQKLAAVIETMMRKNPDQRYQTPADVVEALAPWCQVAIAPPPEAELPTLSAAASATGPHLGSRNGNPLKSSGNGSLPGGPSNGRASAFGFPATKPSRQSSLMTAVTPGPAGEGWAALTSDTQPRGLAETQRNPIPQLTPARLAAPAPARGPSSGKLLLGVVVLGGLAAGAFFAFGKKAFVAGHANVPTLYVSKRPYAPDPDKAHATLRAALAVATPGTKIQILDDTLDEPAIPTLGGKDKLALTDCVVEPGPGLTTVTWSVAPNVSGPAAASALEVQAVAGLRISGLTVDCGGHTEFGVSVLGTCPGLTFERVEIRRPNAAGVRLNGATGDPGRPIRFDRVRVVASDGKPLVAGVLLTAQSGNPNKSVRFTNGRLDGPGTDAVRIAGPVSDVEWTGNRVSAWANGVTLSSGMPADGTCKLLVSANAFYRIADAVLRCDTPMPPGVKGDVSFRQNLFLRCGDAARGPAGAVAGLTFADNARDASTRDAGSLTLGSHVVDGTVATDPALDATYLRTPPGSAFSAVGPKKVSVGATGD
jgi:serine/threonine protein kinase